MALFERDRLSSRSALSRFLAALTKEPVEALRTLLLDELLARPLTRDRANRRDGGSSREHLDRWMARGKRPGNAPCLRPTICLQLFAGWILIPIAGAATQPGDRRSLSVRRSVGVEPETGTGPSPHAGAGTYHRVCSRSPTSCATHGPSFRLCISRSGLNPEGWTLLGPRFYASTGWNAPLPSKPGTSCPGIASRNRWQLARGVWSQHPELPSLSSARTVPVEWQRHHKATPGQHPPASAGCWE